MATPNVAIMSQAEKYRAWEIIHELKRYKAEEGIRYFNPTKPPHNDQWAFLHSDAKERWGFGGNRSGKTILIVADADKFARGVHPVRSKYRKPPVFIRFVGTSWEHGVGVLLKKFKQMVIRSELAGGSWSSAWSEKGHTLTYKNGSQIKFMTSEQDVNKHAGDDLDAVYFDEHIPKPYYDENIVRLIDRNGYVAAAMTPEEGITWEADHVQYPPPGVNIEHWFFDTERNPHLSADGVAAVVASITDPNLAAAKLHGQFVPLTGMVYPTYRADLLMIRDFDIDLNWPRVVAIDPHIRKFTAILWVAWSPDGEPIVYRAKKVKMTVPDLANFLRAQCAGERIDLWIGDEAMGGDGKNIWGEESVLVGLQNHGIPVMPTNQSSDKAFKAGVEKVREYLQPDAITGKPKLRIFESLNVPPEYIDGKLTGSIFWEFGKYRFRKEQKSDEENFREKVATVDDDYLDDLRYGLMAGPRTVYREMYATESVDDPERDSFTGW